MFIKQIELENFYALRKLGGRFSQSFKDNLITIRGNNGIGKSFILSHLSPFFAPFNMDSKLKPLNDNEIMKKIMVFEIDGKEYKSEIDYTNRKAYLYIRSDEEYELVSSTQSGNITQYDNTIADLLKVNKNFIEQTFYMGEFMLNILRLSPKERRELLIKQIEQLNNSVYVTLFEKFKNKEAETKLVLEHKKKEYLTLREKYKSVLEKYNEDEIARILEQKKADMKNCIEEGKKLSLSVQEFYKIEERIKLLLTKKGEIQKRLNNFNQDELLKEKEELKKEYEKVKDVQVKEIKDTVFAKEFEFIEENFNKIPIKNGELDFEKIKKIYSSMEQINEKINILQVEQLNLQSDSDLKSLNVKLNALEKFQIDPLQKKKQELEEEINKTSIKFDERYSLESIKMFSYFPELYTKYSEEYDKATKNYYSSIKNNHKALYNRIEKYFKNFDNVKKEKEKELEKIKNEIKELFKEKKKIENEIKKIKLQSANRLKQIEKEINGLKKEKERLEEDYRGLVLKDINDKTIIKLQNIVKKYKPKNKRELLSKINEKIKEIEKENELMFRDFMKKTQIESKLKTIELQLKRYEEEKEILISTEKQIKDDNKSLEQLQKDKEKFEKMQEKYYKLQEEINQMDGAEKISFGKKDLEELEEKLFVFNKLKNYSKNIQEMLVKKYFEGITRIANFILKNDESDITKYQIDLELTRNKIEFYVIDENNVKRELSTLSGGESVLVSKALSTAIALSNKNNFKLMLMDESDSKLSIKNKILFNEFLKKVLEVDIEQIFIVTHSNEIIGKQDVILK